MAENYAHSVQQVAAKGATLHTFSSPQRDKLQQLLPSLQAHYQQPLVLMSRQILARQVARFQAALPTIAPHFAVKANPHPDVLRCLMEAGTGFEVASKAELDQLLAMGVQASKVFYSNPVKSPHYIAYAASMGVEWFALDSVEELEKIHRIAPAAKLYLRIYTSNKGSSIELSAKFGASREDVSAVIARAAALGADLAGVTFHVGSQCCNVDNWRLGIERSAEIFGEMHRAGLEPRLLDLGGGYPVSIDQAAPSLELIAQVIHSALQPLLVEFGNITVIAEPGRFLVAEAGLFVCQVVAASRRDQQNWLYLDAGFYGGLLEIKEGLEYPITTLASGPEQSWVLAGPTCDSIDICSDQYRLPASLQAGDWVMVGCAGAYSNACACEFNGFPLPKVVME
ncbi:ornithine decarboxylase [Sinobacterium caligoides]|uniref:ornithine decarboxylase n=1 Tax=Sinobacterium caligoides TaxID=933926 RepID=A0A3N2DNS2_9GAMM|nr:type III PLP-dependent enzyme [Sinobacterium caligoides]ROS01463.1 ornithine decarboxylase [Sinobacterium caligoides]